MIDHDHDDEADDIDRLRRRQGEADDAATRPPEQTGEGASVVVGRVQTTTGSGTTRFYKMAPVAVLGAETEGGAGTTTAGTVTFLAKNLGGTVPPVGVDVICTRVPHRWVFRYD